MIYGMQREKRPANSEYEKYKRKFPELILVDAMLHLALTRNIRTYPGAIHAMTLLRSAYWRLKVGVRR